MGWFGSGHTKWTHGQLCSIQTRLQLIAILRIATGSDGVKRLGRLTSGFYFRPFRFQVTTIDWEFNTWTFKIQWVFVKFSKIQYHIVRVYIELLFLRWQIFRFCTAAFYPQWQWRHVRLSDERSFFGDYWYVLWLNWRTFRLWTMLKQL